MLVEDFLPDSLVHRFSRNARPLKILKGWKLTRRVTMVFHKLDQPSDGKGIDFRHRCTTETSDLNVVVSTASPLAGESAGEIGLLKLIKIAVESLFCRRRVQASPVVFDHFIGM